MCLLNFLSCTYNNDSYSSALWTTVTKCGAVIFLPLPTAAWWSQCHAVYWWSILGSLGSTLKHNLGCLLGVCGLFTQDTRMKYYLSIYCPPSPTTCASALKHNLGGCWLCGEWTYSFLGNAGRKDGEKDKVGFEYKIGEVDVLERKDGYFWSSSYLGRPPGEEKWQ